MCGEKVCIVYELVLHMKERVPFEEIVKIKVFQITEISFRRYIRISEK